MKENYLLEIINRLLDQIQSDVKEIKSDLEETLELCS